MRTRTRTRICSLNRALQGGAAAASPRRRPPRNERVANWRLGAAGRWRYDTADGLPGRLVPLPALQQQVSEPPGATWRLVGGIAQPLAGAQSPAAFSASSSARPRTSSSLVVPALPVLSGSNLFTTTGSSASSWLRDENWWTELVAQQFKAGERVASGSSSDLTPLLQSAPSLDSGEYREALAAMADEESQSTPEHRREPETVLPPPGEAASVLQAWLDALPPVRAMQDSLPDSDDGIASEVSGIQPRAGVLTNPPSPGNLTLSDDQCSTVPDFFQISEPRTPSQQPFDWWTVLNRLTQQQLDELNQTAADIALRDETYHADDLQAPQPVSGPPDDEQNDDRESDQSDDDDDPDQEQEDSVLTFINQAERGSVTSDHHPQFAEPSSPDIPTSDHRVQSILSEGAKTFIPPEARQFHNVTFQSRINSEIIQNLAQAGIIEKGPVSSTYRLFALPKKDGRVRVLYDLSQLTPYLIKPTCHLPRPMDVLANGNAQFAIKIDLSDGFFLYTRAPKTAAVPGNPIPGNNVQVEKAPDGLGNCSRPHAGGYQRSSKVCDGAMPRGTGVHLPR